MFGWLKRRVGDLFGGSRSGQWSAWRKRHLEQEPECQACGTTEKLEVHHILPVHAGGPELADPGGLITLCRPCHICIGHANDTLSWRPDVRRLAWTIRSAEVRRLPAPDKPQ